MPSRVQDGVAGGNGARGTCTIAARGGGATWQPVITGTADPALRPALAAFAKTFDLVLQQAWHGGASSGWAVSLRHDRRGQDVEAGVAGEVA